MPCSQSASSSTVKSSRCRRSIASSSVSSSPASVRSRLAMTLPVLATIRSATWPICEDRGAQLGGDRRVRVAHPGQLGDVPGEVAHPLQVRAHPQAGDDDAAGRSRPAAAGRAGRASAPRGRPAARRSARRRRSRSRRGRGRRPAARSWPGRSPTRPAGSSRPSGRTGRRAPRGTARASSFASSVWFCRTGRRRACPAGAPAANRASGAVNDGGTSQVNSARRLRRQARSAARGSRAAQPYADDVNPSWTAVLAGLVGLVVGALGVLRVPR